MTADASAKTTILRRIHDAHGASSTEASAQTSWATISRDYVRTAIMDPDERLALFAARLRDYDATLIRSQPEQIALRIAETLQARQRSRIVIPSGITEDWLPKSAAFVVDESLTAQELDAFDGVLTLSTMAIAETGTVVLQNVAGQGRRALSLVPDYHLCLVHRENLVATVPEAIRCLQKNANLATTFISGPSATADIEMTRIKGVHGPRILDVLFIL